MMLQLGLVLGLATLVFVDDIALSDGEIKWHESMLRTSGDSSEFRIAEGDLTQRKRSPSFIVYSPRMVEDTG